MYDIDKLKRIAKTSEVNNKHAAGLIYNKNICSFAVNKYIHLTNCKTIHAEVNLLYTLKNRGIKLNGMDIIVVRINNDASKLKNSRPCNNCIDILKKLGIRKVHYSNSNGDIVMERVCEMNKIHVSSWNRNQHKLLP